MNIYTLIFVLILAAMVIVGVIAYLKGRKPGKQIKDGLCEINAESGKRAINEQDSLKGAGI